MVRQVIWSPASEKDFEKILEYLQLRWNSKTISKFINKIDDIILLIRKDPKIFPIINKKLQIRKSVITKQNTLYYREIHKGIEIVRLFDSRQDSKKLIFT
ncbi:MAG: type II toxin-antitoxin system RelE/ParE family toxin [Polaribacter sp.]